jgi:hypothetical protein
MLLPEYGRWDESLERENGSERTFKSKSEDLDLTGNVRFISV